MKTKLLFLLLGLITFCYAPLDAQETPVDTSYLAEIVEGDTVCFLVVGEDKTVIDCATLPPMLPPGVDPPKNPNPQPPTEPAPTPEEPAKPGFFDEVTSEQLFSWWTIGVAALINLVMYLSGLFPGFTFIQDDRKRDLAVKAIVFTVLVGAVLAFSGSGGNVWNVVLGFFLSAIGYDKALQPLLGKTKTKAVKKS